MNAMSFIQNLNQIGDDGVEMVKDNGQVNGLIGILKVDMNTGG